MTFCMVLAGMFHWMDELYPIKGTQSKMKVSKIFIDNICEEMFRITYIVIIAKYVN